MSTQDTTATAVDQQRLVRQLRCRSVIAGDLYREGRITRTEAFRLEMDAVLGRDTGPINYQENTDHHDMMAGEGLDHDEYRRRMANDQAQLRAEQSENSTQNESGALAAAPCSAFPPVLDACCGSRMFWFDRKDKRALFIDKRRERHLAADCSVKNGEREIVVDPDIVADFTALPFPDNSFLHVVFDPPHVQRNGDTSWILKKYGVLRGQWRDMLRDGFKECFRVLKPGGTLVFKWCETEIPLREILALTPEKPLYGHRTGKQARTHWVSFIKE